MTTKTELCNRASRILFSGNITPEDDAFLREIVKGHPIADVKIGPGIDHFEIRRGGRFNQNVLFLVRIDGTATDISFRQCINGESSHRTKVLAAMRAAIADQVIAFRDHALTTNARCSITGIPLTRENIHVDHDPPFIEIAKAFLASEGGAENVTLTDDGDGQIGRTLADKRQMFAWQDYHRERAVLFPTDAHANMRKGRKSFRSYARDGIDSSKRANEDDENEN